MKFLKNIDFKQVITHNFWLKVISLIIAITIWIYVSGEITRGIRV